MLNKKNINILKMNWRSYRAGHAIMSILSYIMSRDFSVTQRKLSFTVTPLGISEMLYCICVKESWYEAIHMEMTRTDSFWKRGNNS